MIHPTVPLRGHLLQEDLGVPRQPTKLQGENPVTWDLLMVGPVHRCLCFLDRLQGPGGEHTPAGK